MKSLIVGTAFVLVIASLSSAAYAQEKNTSSQDNQGSCTQYPRYTGGATGGHPAPANGTAGPMVPPECQGNSR